MTARGRILVIRLLEQQEKNPAYLKRLGVCIKMTEVKKDNMERRNARV